MRLVGLWVRQNASRRSAAKLGPMTQKGFARGLLLEENRLVLQWWCSLNMARSVRFQVAFPQLKQANSPCFVDTPARGVPYSFSLHSDCSRCIATDCRHNRRHHEEGGFHSLVHRLRLRCSSPVCFLSAGMVWSMRYLNLKPARYFWTCTLPRGCRNTVVRAPEGGNGEWLQHNVGIARFVADRNGCDVPSLGP